MLAFVLKLNMFYTIESIVVKKILLYTFAALGIALSP